MCSVDLKDAYLSVPIAKQHRKLLRFVWEETTYEFTCLPFGLCSAPRIFTKLLHPVVAHLRFQGLRTVIYLDDMLIMAEDRETLQQQVHQALTLLEKLGFVINIPKSSLIPSRQITYLGLLVDSVSMKLRLTEEKLQQMTHSCRELAIRPSVTVQDLSSVIGKLTATRLAVLPAPVYTRSLQQQLIETLRSTGSFKARMTLNRASRDDLQWWINQLQHWNGRAIMTPPPDMIIHSDASLQGWGAVYNGTRTGGLWSIPERKRHINSLELLAGSLAIQTFAKHRNNVHILLRMDNTTAVAYVNKMGGTHSPSLSLQACQLWQWCLQRGINLSAEHLPGNLNTMADRESRQRETSAEWMLNKEVFQMILQTLGPCKTDLFATRLNHQLPAYISWRPDPFAQGTDALHVEWRSIDGYAFPPFCLIGRCIQKVRHEHCTITIVVPWWHSQA